MPHPAHSDLATLSFLARAALEDAGLLEALARAEEHFRSRVRESEALTHAAACEGASAVFAATLTELLDGALARRPR